MSDTDTTATYDPEHWVHRRTEVDAIAYDGTEHARVAIARWVAAEGGEVMDRGHTKDGALFVLGARGFLPLITGDHCVRSIDVPGRGREFFPMGHDVLTEAYVRGVDYSATLAPDQLASLLAAATATEDPRELRRLLVAMAKSHELLR